MSICTNESTTKIGKLSSRELNICTNLGQIRENIGVHTVCKSMLQGQSDKPTCNQEQVIMPINQAFKIYLILLHEVHVSKYVKCFIKQH